MNSPGPIPDPSGAIDPNTGLIKMVIDPYFNRQYSQFCYTLQYLPGKTTYLDTPVVPVAAFAGRSQNPLDCDLANATPMIYSVTGANASGPYVPAGGGTLTLVSAGNVEVPNPYYDPAVAGSTKTLMRDYGFGAAGSVTLNGVPLTVNTWTNDLIQVTVPSGASTGELLVTRGSGAGSMTSDVGITVQVGGTVHQVPAGGSIQAVIDDPLTHDGDIVMVPPGTYNEYVIMDKRIKLQGWGAMSTTINAAKIGTTGLKKWRDLVNRKIDATPANPPVIDPDTGQNTLNPGPNRTFDVLPGQVLGLNVSNNEPLLFGAEEGPGVLVVGRATTTGTDGHFSTDRARIDGITITGADAGGGILASGYARFLEVSNNRIVSNYGTYGGGVRIGHTALLDDTNTAYGGYTNSQNGCLPGQSCTVGVNIHHNWIAENGSTEAGGGGGVSIGNGAGSYQVANNYICGNFSMADGGGIGHLGISNGGKIVNNKVIFNQTFNQSLNATGAGIYVGGLASLDATGLSPGTGNVTIDANLIQGNNAGAGAGGGVRLAQVNGLDVGNSPTSTTPWNQVTLTNNMIVDNVAAYAGGGVALVDALKVNASNNTIANNDSTATNMQSFANAGDTVSQPQPAGLVSFATSSAITSRLTGTLRTANRFSNPVLHNEIVWHNRSFCWAVTGPGPGEYGLFDANADGSCNTGSPAGTAPNYVDLAVLGTAAQGSYANKYVGAGVDKLIPDHSILSALLGTDGYQNNSNLEADPGFVSAYFNGSAKPAPIIPGYTTLIQTAATTDEGGNFIDIRFGPLTPWNCLTPTDTNGQPASQSNCPLYGDYHLASDASPAVNVGLSRVTGNGVPVSDFDSDPRPASAIDIGADERSLPRADLAIFNSDGQTSVTRGTSVTYNIVVSNLGPTPVTGAVVADARPAGITSASWNWTCAGAGCGPTGNSGTGNINKTLGTLAVNASVTFTATGTVSSTATSLSNTASVAAPNTVVDVVTANNSATDTDTILLGTASFSPNPVAFGNIATNTTATRTVTVTNTGTQPLVIASATVSGPRFGKGTDSCSGQTLPVNGTCTVNVTFNPNNNNQRRGALTLVHNGLNSPQSVVLSGQ
ncbi:MAG: DUF11 domain-containing protein [Thiobacillus sp.]|nr:DUF11 domain-containing protein [Thiobacillus sp.]